MRKLTQKTVEQRYTKYEYNYIKPKRVKIPLIHDTKAEETQDRNALNNFTFRIPQQAL